MLEAEETRWSTSHFVDVVAEALTAELAQSPWASGQDKGPGFLTPVLSVLLPLHRGAYQREAR